MSRAAKSMLAFGIYLFGLGVVLLVDPNALLSLFGLPPTEKVWLRVVGTLVFLLGAYDSLAARHALRPFFRWTVVARSSVFSSSPPSCSSATSSLFSSFLAPSILSAPAGPRWRSHPTAATLGPRRER